MCTNVCLYMCTTYVQCPRGQQRASNTLEKELQFEQPRGCWNSNQVLGKRSALSADPSLEPRLLSLTPQEHTVSVTVDK